MDIAYTGFITEHGPQVRAGLIEMLTRHSFLSDAEAAAAADFAMDLAERVEATFTDGAADAPDEVSGASLFAGIGVCRAVFERMEQGILATADQLGEDIGTHSFALGAIH